jgi:endonuclease YncB( thermonuclease family)
MVRRGRADKARAHAEQDFSHLLDKLFRDARRGGMIRGMTGPMILRNLLLLAGAACALGAKVAAAGELRGPARVIDGDTLEVAGRRLDLADIDAPEDAQTCQWPNKRIACGEIAAGALKDLTTAVDVVCTPLKPAGGGDAAPAHCRADGYDLGWNMVHTGWAVASPGAPPAYRDAQAGAKAAGRGLWKGAFELPWVWRESATAED